SAAPTVSAGKAMFIPIFARRSWCTRYLISSVSIAGLGSTKGSHVGYTEVTTEFNGNGKTLSKFSLPASVGVATEDCSGTCLYNRTVSFGINCGDGYVFGCPNDNFPFADHPNYYWNRGNLLEENVFNNAGTMVKKVLNEYTIKSTGSNVKCVKVAPSSYNCSVHTDGVNFWTYYDAYFKCAKYYHISAWQVLSKTTVEEYDPGVPGALLHTETFFNYDNASHMKLTSSKTYDSRGRELKTEYKRPQDYAANTNFANSLINLHVLNPVL